MKSKQKAVVVFLFLFLVFTQSNVISNHEKNASTAITTTTNDILCDSIKKHFKVININCPLRSDTFCWFSKIGMDSFFKSDSLFFINHIKPYIIKNKLINLNDYFIDFENPAILNSDSLLEHKPDIVNSIWNRFSFLGLTLFNNKEIYLLCSTEDSEKYILLNLTNDCNVISHINFASKVSRGSEAGHNFIYCSIDCDHNIFQKELHNDPDLKDSIYQVINKHYVLNFKSNFKLIETKKYYAMVSLWDFFYGCNCINEKFIGDHK